MYPGAMIDYGTLWAQTLKILPAEILDEVGTWSELDQISIVTEARGRAMYRNPESNGPPLAETVRQVVLERLGPPVQGFLD